MALARSSTRAGSGKTSPRVLPRMCCQHITIQSLRTCLIVHTLLTMLTTAALSLSNRNCLDTSLIFNALVKKISNRGKFNKLVTNSCGRSISYKANIHNDLKMASRKLKLNLKNSEGPSSVARAEHILRPDLLQQVQNPTSTQEALRHLKSLAEVMQCSRLAPVTSHTAGMAQPDSWGAGADWFEPVCTGFWPRRSLLLLV